MGAKCPQIPGLSNARHSMQGSNLIDFNIKRKKKKKFLILSYWSDLDHFFTTEPIPLIVLGHFQQLCMRNEVYSYKAAIRFEALSR